MPRFVVFDEENEEESESAHEDNDGDYDPNEKEKPKESKKRKTDENEKAEEETDKIFHAVKKTLRSINESRIVNKGHNAKLLTIEGDEDKKINNFIKDMQKNPEGLMPIMPLTDLLGNMTAQVAAHISKNLEKTGFFKFVPGKKSKKSILILTSFLKDQELPNPLSQEDHSQSQITVPMQTQTVPFPPKVTVMRVQNPTQDQQGPAVQPPPVQSPAQYYQYASMQSPTVLSQIPQYRYDSAPQPSPVQSQMQAQQRAQLKAQALAHRQTHVPHPHGPAAHPSSTEDQLHALLRAHQAQVLHSHGPAVQPPPARNHVPHSHGPAVQPPPARQMPHLHGPAAQPTPARQVPHPYVPAAQPPPAQKPKLITTEEELKEQKDQKLIFLVNSMSEEMRAGLEAKQLADLKAEQKREQEREAYKIKQKQISHEKEIEKLRQEFAGVEEKREAELTNLKQELASKEAEIANLKQKLASIKKEKETEENRQNALSSAAQVSYNPEGFITWGPLSPYPNAQVLRGQQPPLCWPGYHPMQMYPGMYPILPPAVNSQFTQPSTTITGMLTPSNPAQEKAQSPVYSPHAFFKPPTPTSPASPLPQTPGVQTEQSPPLTPLSPPTPKSPGS